MSTVVSNAYKINTKDGEEIQEINDKIKAFFKKELLDVINKYIVDSYIDYKYYKKDNKRKSFWSFYEDSTRFNFNNYSTSILIESLKSVSSFKDLGFYKLYIDIIDFAVRNNIPCDFNKKAICYFKTYKGNTYYHISGNGDIVKKFREEYKNIVSNDFTIFDYWNNTDKPDNISDEEWENRESVWNNIIDRTYSGEFNEFTTTIESYNIYSPDCIMKYIPSEYECLLRYHRELTEDNYFIDELNRQTYAGESKSNGKAGMYARSKIEEDINTGKIYEYVDSMKKDKLDFDSILKNIFKDGFNYPKRKRKKS